MPIELSTTLTGHKSSIYKILIDERSSYIYSLGGDGYLVRWNENSQDGILVAYSDDNFISGSMISEKLLVAGGLSGQLYWFDLELNTIVKRVLHHTKAIFGCLLDHDIIYTVSKDGSLVSWDIKSMSPIVTFVVTSYGLRSIENLDEKNLLLGSMDGYLYVVDKETFSIVSRWKAHENSIFSVKIDENFIYSGGRDALLKKWKKESFLLTHSVAAHWYTINDILLIENLLITASRDKKIRVWDTDLNLIQSKDLQQGGHLNSVNSLSIIQDSKKLVSCSDDRTIKIWDISI